MIVQIYHLVRCNGKNGNADTWHTQTTTGDVTATNVRIVVKGNANLGQHMALRINGQDILQTNLETLKSNEGLTLQADGKYQFEHIEFSSQKAGGSGGEENPPQQPQPPATQGMELILEGNARDKFDEMIAAGNDANNIYVKVNGEASYQKINDLIESGMVTVSLGRSLSVCKFCKKVSLYVKYDTNYMVQFMPNAAGMGFSEKHRLFWMALVRSIFRLIKRSTRLPGHMTMCVMAKMLIWSMEQRKS